MAPDLNDFEKSDAKQNLLLVYVESLELGMRNETAFNVNLIAAIDDLPGEIVPVTQVSGTGWSVAGMVASQCAIPLKTYYGNYLDDMTNFLPNVVCLGDVLDRLGYQQYFLVGPDVTFGGMENFYRDHGYEFRIGQHEWQTRISDQTFFDGWGQSLHDDTLLEQAKEILIEASKSSAPFNMTIITTDNHAPNGRPSPRCLDDEKSSGFPGTFRCTSRIISSFINGLDKSGYLKNTLLVIMGDHLFMGGNPTMLPPPRSIYFKIRAPHKTVKQKHATHFDVAPTILDGLGLAKYPNKRFGLGYSLFADIPRDIFDMHHEEVKQPSINYSSHAYTAFWRDQSK